MLSSVFLKTLRDRRRGLIWWSLGIVLYALFIGAFWPVLEDSRETLQSLLEAYPQELVGLFGVDNADDMFTPAGYLASQAFGWLVPVVFAIFAAAMGAQLIAGEEEAKTLDLLLANPISRGRVVLEKWLALGAVVFVLGSVLFASVLLIDALFGFRIAFDRYLAICIQATLLGILFGSIAFAAGAAGARRGLTLGIVSAAAVATFLINSLGTATDWMETVRYISPFYYYDSHRPLTNGFNWANAGALAIASALALAVARYTLPRRDIGT